MVTNRWLGLPIFAVVMFLVYWIAMVAVGAPATDWANDGVFGDGWHLLGIGSKEYNTVNDDYTAAIQAVDAFLGTEIDPRPRTLTPRPCWPKCRASSQLLHRHRGRGGRGDPGHQHHDRLL